MKTFTLLTLSLLLFDLGVAAVGWRLVNVEQAVIEEKSAASRAAHIGLRTGVGPSHARTKESWPAKGGKSALSTRLA
jgi:hypothetical protein